MNIKKIAELARLSVSEKEEALYKEQMLNIMKYFTVLEQVDTEGIIPLVSPVETEEYRRKDVVEIWEAGVEGALQNAPDKKGNLFKVPPVM